MTRPEFLVEEIHFERTLWSARQKDWPDRHYFLLDKAVTGAGLPVVMSTFIIGAGSGNFGSAAGGHRDAHRAGRRVAREVHGAHAHRVLARLHLRQPGADREFAIVGEAAHRSDGAPVAVVEREENVFADRSQG